MYSAYLLLLLLLSFTYLFIYRILFISRIYIYFSLQRLWRFLHVLLLRIYFYYFFFLINIFIIASVLLKGKKKIVVQYELRTTNNKFSVTTDRSVFMVGWLLEPHTEISPHRNFRKHFLKFFFFKFLCILMIRCMLHFCYKN